MSDRRVLVTGASKGIGREIARELGRKGWSVAVHYGTDDTGARCCLEELGPQASGLYQADLEAVDEAKKLFETVDSDGSLYAVVNNAGVYIPHSFVESSDSEFEECWRRTMAINFTAPLFISRAAARGFARKGGGKILNVASRVGFKGESNASIYAASKAALVNLTRSLAVELADVSVGVFGIAPGWVDTSMAREGMSERLPEIISTLPLRRMASPLDCASVASFLLSEEASYLSGQVLDINGASYFH